MTETEYYNDLDDADYASGYVERYFDDCQEIAEDVYLNEDGELIRDLHSCEIDGGEVVNFYDIIEEPEELIEIIQSLAYEVFKLKRDK
jgi:hypothetical protein